MSFLALRSKQLKFDLPDFPSVVTNTASSITSSQAAGNGQVVSEGGSATTVRGFCWSTNPQPTTADNTVTSGSGLGVYTANMTGLAASTTYHYRAYATNAIGTSYGDNVQFTTASAGSTAGNDWPTFQRNGFWNWRYT